MTSPVKLKRRENKTTTKKRRKQQRAKLLFQFRFYELFACAMIFHFFLRKKNIRKYTKRITNQINERALRIIS